jgi:hypothetical protein
MDACLNRLDSRAIDNDRQLRELGIHPETPPSPQTQSQAVPTSDLTQPASPLSPAPDHEASPNKPKRKRSVASIPKTIEEYEATRKPLPPSPVYIPNPKALARFDEIYGPFSPPASSEIRVNLCPSVVENPPRNKPTLLNLWFTPIRIVARGLSAVLTPVLRISNIFANLFARPKPPPVTAELKEQKRAA